MKKIVLGLISLTLLATACKKDKDAPAITVQNVAGNYKITAATSTPSAGGQTTDEYALFMSCEKDDVYKLSASGTFEYADAGEICDPAGDWSGDWSISESGTGDKKLIFDGYEMGKITKFDGSVMEILDEESDPGTSYKITMKKQ